MGNTILTLYKINPKTIIITFEQPIQAQDKTSKKGVFDDLKLKTMEINFSSEKIQT